MNVKKILNLAYDGSINIHTHSTILCNTCLQVVAEIFLNIPNYSGISIYKIVGVHVCVCVSVM